MGKECGIERLDNDARVCTGLERERGPDSPHVNWWLAHAPTTPSFCYLLQHLCMPHDIQGRGGASKLTHALTTRGFTPFSGHYGH